MLGVSQLFSWFSNYRGHLAIRNHAPRLAELATRMTFLCGVEFTLWRYLLRSMLDISEVQRWAQGVNCLDVRWRWPMEVAGDVQGELGFGFSQNFDWNQFNKLTSGLKYINSCP